MSMTIKVMCPESRRSKEPFEYAPGYVFVSDLTCRDYDWLVVYDEMHVEREVLSCPRERTILLTGEPTSIKGYSRAYTRQFGHLLTNRPFEAECHPHYHLGRGYYYWFVDKDYQACVSPVARTKDRLVSACISAKQMSHTRHRDRFDLMSGLVKSVSGLDWFGRGVRHFDRKYDVLEPYKYHVTVENHLAPHHWSEKIADAFLCECLPFYAGDPLLWEVFPVESYIPIPIDDPNEAARIINAAIAGDEYEKRREAVLEAKRLVLTKYNIWAQVIGVIESSRDQMIADEGVVAVYSRRTLRQRSISAMLEDGWMHVRRCIVGGGV